MSGFLSRSSPLLASMVGAAAPLLVLAGTAQAQGVAPDPRMLISAEVVEETRAWLSNPIVAMSVEAQNRAHAGFDQAAIDALDLQWRAEREQDDKPLIAATLSSPLSTYLLRVQAGALGLYTEVFVTDELGLNVGQSAITGDYWQGDEEKFLGTVPQGPTAWFIDDAEWDEERAIWRAQANISIADESGTRAIGAATVEFNLTELQRRLAAGS